MDNNIRIRVAKEHKEWLIKQAEEKDIKVSQVVRDLINEAMKK